MLFLFAYIWVKSVEMGHEVGVYFRLFGLNVFLVTFEHVVGGVTHALHRVLFGDVEGGHDGGVVVAEAVKAASDAALFGNGGKLCCDGVSLIAGISRVVAGLFDFFDQPGGGRDGALTGVGFGIFLVVLLVRAEDDGFVDVN